MELYSVYTYFSLKAHDWCHLPGELVHCWDLEETGEKNAAVNKRTQIKPRLRNPFFLWHSRNTYLHIYTLLKIKQTKIIYKIIKLHELYLSLDDWMRLAHFCFNQSFTILAHCSLIFSTLFAKPSFLTMLFFLWFRA